MAVHSQKFKAVDQALEDALSSADPAQLAKLHAAMKDYDATYFGEARIRRGKYKEFWTTMERASAPPDEEPTATR